jgi:ubiquinone/menaquinone biosynthesis C-methylase UbiE
MKAPYDPVPAEWDRVAWESLDPRHGRLRMQQVLRHIPLGGRHLDVGTGRGDGTLLVGKVTRCVGLEYGSKSAAIAADSGCTIVRGDARRLPFAAASFDSITCLDVLEHVPRPAEAILELARVLRAGGLLILETPNRELFKERCLRLARSLGFRQKQPYDVPLPLAELRRHLRAAALTVVIEQAIQCWDDNRVVRRFSWSRLFVCRNDAGENGSG